MTEQNLPASPVPIASQVPAREFRRGGPVLLAAFTGSAAGVAALPFYSLAFFMEPLEAEFGWSRSAVGAAATVLTLGMFITGPVVGRLCDRYGVRRVIVPSILLYALALVAMTTIHGAPWSLYLGYAGLAVAGAATSPVAYARAVTSWFDRGRGLALGVMMCGSGVAAMLAPLLVSGIIQSHGWRAGWLALAAVSVLQAPIAWRLLRERDLTVATGPVFAATGLAMSDAVRTRAFWSMGVGILLISAAVSGVAIHLTPLLRDTGLSGAAVARLAAMIGIGIIIGRLSTGLLLDRFHGSPAVAVAVFLLCAAGFAMIGWGPAPVVPAGVILLGLAMGAEGDMLAYFASRHFGMKAFAEIFGWLFGAICLGTAAGPLIAGGLYSRFHVYDQALLTAIVLAVAAAMLFATLSRHPKAAMPREKA